jgi:hypothetical protein
MSELEPPPKVPPAEVEERERKDLMKKLEEFGFDKSDILKSLSQEDFNQITASFFLLQQQHAHNQQQPHPTVTRGGGCPFAHLSIKDEGEKPHQGKDGEAEAEDGHHHHHHHNKDKEQAAKPKEIKKDSKKESKKDSKGEKHAHKAKKDSKDSKKASDH